jgi:hypothetical protein
MDQLILAITSQEQRRTNEHDLKAKAQAQEQAQAYAQEQARYEKEQLQVQAQEVAKELYESKANQEQMSVPFMGGRSVPIGTPEAPDAKVVEMDEGFYEPGLVTI